MNYLWIFGIHSGRTLGFTAEVGVVDTKPERALARLRNDPQFGDWIVTKMEQSDMSLILHSGEGIVLGYRGNDREGTQS